MYKIQVKLTNMKLNRKITKQIPSFCIRQPCRRYYNRSRKFRSRMNQKTVNYFFELRHLRSVSSNNNNLVYCTFSRIKLYFTQQYSRDTTTCFGPIMWAIFTQYQKNTPHILYSGPCKVRSQPEDGPHIGPKHVVSSLLYY